MITVCEEYGISYIRMLRLLSQMVQTRHRTVEEVIVMADTLVKDRGKWIAKSDFVKLEAIAHYITPHPHQVTSFFETANNVIVNEAVEKAAIYQQFSDRWYKSRAV